MTFPTLIVEAALAGPSTGTYLHWDDAARGLWDTATWAPDDVWTDISAYVRSFSTRRGASRVESPAIRYEAGTATITLNNSDRRFDPENLSGPYVSAGVTQIKPMIAVRIRVRHDGTVYSIYRGFADDWGGPDENLGPNYDEVTLTCTDAVEVLSNYDRPAVADVGGSEHSGVRVSRILDSAGWSTTDRIIATGDTTLQATTLAGNAWEEILLVQDTELGEVYVDEDGRVVFRNRNAMLTDTRSNTSQATFGDGGGTELRYERVGRAYDKATLANLVRITRAGGTEQTAEDAASQDNYLIRTHERSDLLMESDTAAADYATFVLGAMKDPELRFDTLTINPRRDETALFPQVLGRRFGDRVTVVRRPPGGGSAITRDVIIRGVTHEADAATRRWKTVWTLQAAQRWAGLVWDHPTLGLWDANRWCF